MTIIYKDYEKFANMLVKDVLEKLTGSHKDFERRFMSRQPHYDILIGNLSGIDMESDSGDDSKTLNTISVKFLIEDFKDEISIHLDFSLYFRVLPTFEEQNKYLIQKNSNNIALVPIWQRKDVQFDFIIDQNFEEENLDFEDIVAEINQDKNLYRKKVFLKKDILENEEEYNKFIETQRKPTNENFLFWESVLKLNKRKFTQNGKDYLLIDISFENLSPIVKDKLFEASLFNPVLEINLGDNVIHPFKYKSSKDEFYDSYLRCLNCQGDFDRLSNKITTKNYGIFNQEKNTPVSYLDDVDISFKTLSAPNGIFELEKIYQLMNKHLKNSSEDDEDYHDFIDMKERFKANIDLIKSNEIVAHAFYLMNETFEKNSKGKYDEWRLFQIVFIVSQLGDIVFPDTDRDTCELLHVMTGGGKSEAYFGIVVFNAFFDRLSGKRFGVTAVTKFPLRMLSVQQLERIANVFIFAEQLRKREEIAGEPFSIAYFVGSQDTEFPSDNYKIISKIRTARAKDEQIPGKIISKCPLCGGDVYLDIDERRELILHKCDNCGEKFRLFYCDDEIYRTLPTFIVSTVDKWAGIALNRRFRNLLGGQLDKCEEGHGYIPSNDFCSYKLSNRRQCRSSGEMVDIDFDTGPTLIIQDEMHLIREGFGTIDSHFESLIESMKSEFSNGVKFKNIAMTATVTGAEKQIKELYHKNTRVFPPLLENKNGDNFFFIKEHTVDGEKIYQRQIIGLKPNGQNFLLSLLVLRYVSEFLKQVEENLPRFSRKSKINMSDLNEIISNYKKLLTYHNKKEEAHAEAYNTDDYINNGQYDLYEIVSRPLTGENDTDYIKDTIATINNFYEYEENKDKILVVNSTSVVSHGVDIDDWNLMIFDGMTRNTSEYIQALSRVGRKVFGIVFISFVFTKTRDLSFYQHFDDYHRILQQKVETVPLSRWAKLGFKQTFTSIFNASVLNYLSNELNMPLYNTGIVKVELAKDENKKLLVDFIKKAYITDSDMKGARYFDEVIEEEMNDRIKAITEYVGTENFFPNALKSRDDKYYRTQFGMRGIQDEIFLVPYIRDKNFISSRRD